MAGSDGRFVGGDDVHMLGDSTVAVTASQEVQGDIHHEVSLAAADAAEGVAETGIPSGLPDDAAGKLTTGAGVGTQAQVRVGTEAQVGDGVARGGASNRAGIVGSSRGQHCEIPFE